MSFPRAPRLLALSILAVLASCQDQVTDPSVSPSAAKGGGGTPGPIASVVVTPATNVLRPGWVQQLTAQAYDASGNPVAGVTFKWTTSDPARATVSKTGLLKGVTAGGPVTVSAQTDTKQPARGSSAVAVLSNQSRLVGGGYAGLQGHTCALDALGLAWCWGSENFGQLGISWVGNDPLSVAVPTRTADATGLISLAGGARFTCGLAADGRAFCWGENGNGQLGNGTFTFIEYTPTLVAGGIPFTSMASNSRGDAHSCALDNSGMAYCWGANAEGFGDGTTSRREVPTPVLQGAIRFVTLAVGGLHTCGLTPTGAAYCWGWNYAGQLGTGAADPGVYPTPQAVQQGALRFVSIALGIYWGCALTAVGEAYCWGGPTGQASSFGPVPQLVPGATRFQSLALGETHACGLDFGGEAYCFGSNNVGQLGNGTTTDVSIPLGSAPVKVIGGHRFSTLGLGQAHSCARGTDGKTYCWGYNLFGQLGEGTFIDRLAPVATLPFGQ